MKLGERRSERVATAYIGATTSDATAGKRRQLDAAYDAADKLPLSPETHRLLKKVWGIALPAAPMGLQDARRSEVWVGPQAAVGTPIL